MKNIINQTIDIIVVLIMVFFAIPKLLGQPQSVEGFKQFESAIYLDATFFRLFTGISEIGLALLILVFAITKHNKLGKMTYIFLLVTMITALILEFFARPTPKTVLVIIALMLTAISIYRLKTIYKIVS